MINLMVILFYVTPEFHSFNVKMEPWLVWTYINCAKNSLFFLLFLLTEYICFILSLAEKMDSLMFWVPIINLEGYYKEFISYYIHPMFSSLINLGVSFSRNDQFQLLFILFPFKIWQTAHLELLMRSTKVGYCLKKILSRFTPPL